MFNSLIINKENYPKQRELYLLFVWFIYFITLLFQTYHGKVEYNSKVAPFFLLAICHGLLFLTVSHFMIPKLLYKGKTIIFILTLTALLFVFGVVEETYLERWILPYRYEDKFDIFSIYGFMGEISVPLLIFSLTRIVFDNFQSQKRAASAEKQNLQTELKFLRSQIQPHILFNSLNSLYDFTVRKSDKAPQLVLELSKVLRYVLYEGDRESISVDKELQFIREYVALQEVQLENRGIVTLEIDSKTASRELVIVPFLLIPFIENSFKHSLRSKEDEIEIYVIISIEHNKLKLKVENTFDKVEISQYDLVESGIGLENVKKRLEILYPNQFILEIVDRENIYQVKLVIDLQKKKKE